MDDIACNNCLLQKKWRDEVCPRCGSVEYTQAEPYPFTIAPPNAIADNLPFLASKCNVFVKSEAPCFLCNNSHYMIYPGTRDEYDYNKVNKLTTLPQCPARVWNHSKIKLGLHELLDKVRIE